MQALCTARLASSDTPKFAEFVRLPCLCSAYVASLCYTTPSRITSGLLDGVNVASLSLMAAVTWQLARASLTDPVTVLIAFAALVVLIRFKINSTWLIAAGALLGLLSTLFR